MLWFCNKLKQISPSKQCRSSGAFCSDYEILFSPWVYFYDEISCEGEHAKIAPCYSDSTHILSVFICLLGKNQGFALCVFQGLLSYHEWARFYSISPHGHQNCFPILIMDSALLIQKWVENSSWLTVSVQPPVKKTPTIWLSNQKNEIPWYRGAISEMPNRSRTASSERPANTHLI